MKNIIYGALISIIVLVLLISNKTTFAQSLSSDPVIVILPPPISGKIDCPNNKTPFPNSVKLSFEGFKPPADKSKPIFVDLYGNFGAGTILVAKYIGTSIEIEIPGYIKDTSGICQPILGGRYTMSLESGGVSKTFNLEIYGVDIAEDKAGGVKNREFELNFVYCKESKLEVVENLVNSQIRKSLPKRESFSRFTVKIIKINRLDGNKFPCNCTLYTAKVASNDTENFTKILKALRNRENSPIREVSPNIIRLSASHSVYQLGPDGKSPFLITTPDFAKIATDDIYLDSLESNKTARLVVLDSGITTSFAIFGKKSITLSPKGSVDTFNSSIPIPTGHGTPIAYIATQKLPDTKVKIFSERVCPDDGHCPENLIIPALCRQYNLAKKGTNGVSELSNTVVNMSLFSPSPSQILESTIKMITDEGMYVTAAAGNAPLEITKNLGIDKSPLMGMEGMYPAGITKSPWAAPFTAKKFITRLFGVAAIDKTAPVPLAPTETSIPGFHENIRACGRWIKGKNPKGQDMAYSGTSFATAVVSQHLLADIVNGVTPNLDPNALICK
jgi:Subtilase family